MIHNLKNMLVLVIAMALLSLMPAMGQGIGIDLPFGPGGDFDPIRDITVKTTGLPSSVRTGEVLRFQLELDIPDGYHITKDLFELSAVEDSFKVIEINLPEGEPSIIGEVLGGTVRADVLIAPMKSGKGLPYTVTFQSCSEGENPMCFPPATMEGTLDLAVEAGRTTLADQLVGALSSSMLLALLIVFLGGIGASLTPCVYPVIPLTVAYVGARSDGKKLKGFVLSVMLVLGIATTYSVLGIISARTGAVFGSIAQHPVFITTLTLIFIAMGLSMFGFYDIQLPASLNTKLQVQRKGLFGAFLMGMATGVLAAPCVGPIIVVLLGWVAQTGSLFKGFLYLFDFAIGMGLLFILIGTFSGVVASLPKAGGWMIKVKYIFGILFFLAAVMFAKPVLGGLFYPALLVACIPLLIALLAGRWVNRKTGFALLVVFFVAIVAIQIIPGQTPHGITNYETAYQQAMDRAKSENRLVVLDFYADWCAACKELDLHTWSNEAVVAEMEKSALLLKLDFTKVSEEGKIFQERYNVYGLPTVIFIGPDGSERGRFAGFRKAESFLELLKAAQQRD